METSLSPVVVCPLNGDARAERALPSACDTASLLGASLELFSAVEDQHMVGRRRGYLEQIGATARGANASRPHIKVVVDPHAPRAIAERSAASNITTVMATSSQPLLHAGYIGSAAERSIRDAANPTVLIGPHNTTKLADIDRVVVPCDGSQLSEAALETGRSWADRLDVPLWVVTALSDRDRARPDFSASAETAYVRQLATEREAQWEVLHGDDPATTIARWAGPALVTMTTHGRSGLSRIMVGSVTTALTRWASGPVLVTSSRSALGQHHAV